MGIQPDLILVDSLGQAGSQYLLENITPEVIAKQYNQVLDQALSKAQ
ncbi:MAG: hypothetical protein F6J90_32990 [Moorea sp. SIOASIH]|nr:hypothetical protein [Moorena sp. SIOASIH]NEO40892.1 hypothetical protein [Moorena sp. SIOASIH]